MKEPYADESAGTDEPEVLAHSEEELTPGCDIHICQSLQPE
jgi:hypothetical protein